MIDTDDVRTRLQEQMRVATAGDSAPPDLLERVHRGAARRRQRAWGAGLTLVVLAGAGALALPQIDLRPAPAELAAPAAPPATELLSVFRADAGRTSLRVQVEGLLRTEQVELPGYVRNTGTTPVVLLEAAVPGTSLRADFPVQSLAPGGERPLTLIRSVDCTTDPDLPAQLDLRLRIRTADGERTVLLPLPETVVSNYRNSHACSPERRAADDEEAEAQQD